MTSVYIKCILGFNGLQYIDDQYFFGTALKSPPVQNRQPGAAEASTTTPTAASASKAIDESTENCVIFSERKTTTSWILTSNDPSNALPARAVAKDREKHAAIVADSQ